MGKIDFDQVTWMEVMMIESRALNIRTASSDMDGGILIQKKAAV